MNLTSEIFSPTTSDTSFCPELLDCLLMFTDMGFIILDESLRIVHITQVVKDNFQLSDRDCGRSIQGLQMVLGKNNIEAVTMEVLEYQAPYQCEIMGDAGIHFKMKIAPFPLSKTQSKGIVISLLDNEENSFALKRQSTAKSNLLAILENTDSSIWSVDTYYCLLTCNQHFSNDLNRRIKGRVQIGDLVLNQRLPKEEVTLWRGLYDRALGGEKFTTTLDISTETKMKFLEVNFNPIRGKKGNITGASCFSRDITEKVEAREKIVQLNKELEERVEKRTLELVATQEELVRSEKKFRGIFENISSGISLVDPNGKLIDVNPALEKILGFDRETLMEMDFNSLAHPKDRGKSKASFQDMIKKGKKFHQLEKRYVRPDGRVVNALMSVSILRKNDGSPDFFISTVQVTDLLKKAERRVMKRKNRQLKKAVDYLDNFVYSIAHDLRSPIANLKQISDLILMLNPGKDPIFDRMKASVQRLDHTASGLIEILDAQKSDSIPFREIDLNQCTQNLKEELREKIKELGAHFQLDFEEKKINYLEPHLESILRNLIQNSLKYSKKGRKPIIRISTEKKGDFIKLTVTDNGIGINLKEAGNQLCKPFKRFTNQASGNGIGLHLIKSMVEKNDGKIKVKSKMGKGTTFEIFLRPYTDGKTSKKIR